MQTLTYAEVGAWVAQHVSQYVDRVQKWARRQGAGRLPFEWVAELQERGAVHYHVLWWLPRRLMLPKADKRGWWSHGSTRTERARCGGAYLAKYASKIESKSGEFPRGLRLFGQGGLDAARRAIRRWWLLPAWVREAWGVEHSPRRCPGGYVSRLTGEVLRSPWLLVGRASDWSYIAIAEVSP